MKQLLTEKDIICAGGEHYKDSFKCKWIDLNNCGRSRLRFYNFGTGFNVYVVENNNGDPRLEHDNKSSIQFAVIKSLNDFKKLCKVYNMKERNKNLKEMNII